MIKFEPKSKLEMFIERMYPHHYGGYKEGWLEIWEIPFLDGKVYHIFTYENGYREIVGSFVD